MSEDQPRYYVSPAPVACDLLGAIPGTMEYVSRDRVIARAEGYDADDKHYYVLGDEK